MKNCQSLCNFFQKKKIWRRVKVISQWRQPLQDIQKQLFHRCDYPTGVRTQEAAVLSHYKEGVLSGCSFLVVSRTHMASWYIVKDQQTSKKDDKMSVQDVSELDMPSKIPEKNMNIKVTCFKGPWHDGHLTFRNKLCFLNSDSFPKKII